MSNPVKGQVTMQAGGAIYRLQLSFNALAVLKRETGLSIQGLIKAFRDQGDDIDPELLCALLWGSTQDHHPELTKAQAGALFPDGGLEELLEKVQEMFSVAFPKGASGKQNPRKAATKA